MSLLFAPYTFGLSQEDERTESAALALSPSDRVLCIASAGEMPLSLLALGAADVTAVDIDVAQLHLTALKLAAVRALPRSSALRFIGYRCAPAEERRDALAAVLPLLAADARAFWERHVGVVVKGAIGAASFETFLRYFVGLGAPFRGRRRVEGLFQCATVQEQASYFDREIGPPSVRALFRFAFHPRVFAKGRLDAGALAERADSRPVGERYFERWRAMCTNAPARDNPVLQILLLGELLSDDAVPACFSAAGVKTLRERFDHLHLVHGDVRATIAESPVGTFDKIQLSNVPDWLAPHETDALLALVAARIARPGRVVWRSLLLDRPLPADLPGDLRVDRALGEQLAATERCPFFRVMPALAP